MIGRVNFTDRENVVFSFVDGYTEEMIWSCKPFIYTVQSSTVDGTENVNISNSLFMHLQLQGDLMMANLTL